MEKAIAIGIVVSALVFIAALLIGFAVLEPDVDYDP